MAITPYLLSPRPASSPLYHSCLLSFTSMGEKGQGHEDKHRKVKVEERETERAEMNHLIWTLAPGRLW